MGPILTDLEKDPLGLSSFHDMIMNLARIEYAVGLKRFAKCKKIPSMLKSMEDPLNT